MSKNIVESLLVVVVIAFLSNFRVFSSEAFLFIIVYDKPSALDQAMLMTPDGFQRFCHLCKFVSKDISRHRLLFALPTSEAKLHLPLHLVSNLA